MTKLDDLVKVLSDNPDLIEKIKDRIRKNEKTSLKLEYKKINGFVYINDRAFYQWILDTYSNLKEYIPKEYHGKLWELVEVENADGSKGKTHCEFHIPSRKIQCNNFKLHVNILPEISEQSVNKLMNENSKLKEENAELKKQLESANKKIASYRRQGRPPKNPPEKK